MGRGLGERGVSRQWGQRQWHRLQLIAYIRERTDSVGNLKLLLDQIILGFTFSGEVINIIGSISCGLNMVGRGRVRSSCIVMRQTSHRLIITCDSANTTGIIDIIVAITFMIIIFIV